MKIEKCDIEYMQRAIELARLGGIATAPNPKVGSILVFQNRIIGEGWHKQCGQAHAEVNAIQNVQDEDRHLIEKSTIYVTLEPCHHTGKTGPCVDLILAHKIPKVVISCQDPFDKVDGKSIQKLRNAGVEVVLGVLEKEGKNLICDFITFITKKRPFIILKWAQSPDGFIGKPSEQVWISNDLSRRLVHRWRSEVAAILVGTTTAMVDNPKLDTRYFGGPSPLRIVLDRQGILPDSLHIFKDEKPIIIVTARQDYPIYKSNMRIWQLDFGANFWQQFMEKAAAENIISILVEGGASILNSLISEGLWDEARIITGATPLYNGIAAPTLSNADLLSQDTLDDNTLVTWKRLEAL